jgi:hypothetical protein
MRRKTSASRRPALVEDKCNFETKTPRDRERATIATAVRRSRIANKKISAVTEEKDD